LAGSPPVRRSNQRQPIPHLSACSPLTHHNHVPPGTLDAHPRFDSCLMPLITARPHRRLGSSSTPCSVVSAFDPRTGRDPPTRSAPPVSAVTAARGRSFWSIHGRCCPARNKVASSWQRPSLPTPAVRAGTRSGTCHGGARRHVIATAARHHLWTRRGPSERSRPTSKWPRRHLPSIATAIDGIVPTYVASVRHANPAGGPGHLLLDV
jgi:hypothetical protein